MLCAVLFSGEVSSAQTLPYTQTNMGINAGLHANIGTHLQDIGVFGNFYLVKNKFQANTELRYTFRFRYLGPRKKYGELQLSQGVFYCYGATESRANPFITAVSNQSAYKNSLGYIYQAYFNSIGTTQQIGTISAQVKDITLLLENDLFARPALDRFRTGAIAFIYDYNKQLQAGVKALMWTGQMGHKKSTTAAQIRSHCYMDSTAGKYTNYSHGILLADFKYNLGYSQLASVAAGVDAEQIRNAIQNKLLHDQVFLPKAWRRYKNCHIPMLDQNGKLFLYQTEQSIRKPRLYFNAALNEPVLY